MRGKDAGTFWGKAKVVADNPARVVTLPLSAHCLDVALVFKQLASLPVIHARLCASAGRPLNDVDVDRLAVLAFLHDLGKANLGFQAKLAGERAHRAGHILELGPLLMDPALADRVRPLMADMVGWFVADEDCEGFLLASWSHHGRILSLAQLAEHSATYHLARKRGWCPDDSGRDPIEAVEELMLTARERFPRAFVSEADALPSEPAFQHRFAGLLMLADWLGSHELFFPIDRPASFDAEQAAAAAVRAVGLDVSDWRSFWRGRPHGFRDIFDCEPRPLQEAVLQVESSDQACRLLILEAETGSGKTEAALAWFINLFLTQKVDSLYFALPTRVAAREIYHRVLDHVARNFPDTESRPPVVLAVPGYVQVDAVPLQRILPDRAAACDDEQQDLRRERLWAAERPKRFLAAPIAVGTIDQALLSALQTRHAHLRSVCLDRSLLVVDEVHASDPYMRRLLGSLLKHHLGAGGYALLLSATLGSHTRTRLIGSVTGTSTTPPLEDACSVPYPALSDLSGKCRPVSATPGAAKRIRFELLPWLYEPGLVLDRVAEALSRGARVLIVLNTVARAIAMQRLAECHPSIRTEWLFECNRVACPHHGRFAQCDRELLDKAVADTFGKQAARAPVLLIGTQTLEQSLDIDADLLVSDLCPADVLLQRVGRLHRHHRKRPDDHQQPTCLVLSYDPTQVGMLLDRQGKPTGQTMRAGLGSVYADLRTVELTRRRLLASPEVDIPEENRGLVEAVTHPEPLADIVRELDHLAGDDRWKRHAETVDGGILAQEITAYYALAPYDTPFGEASFDEMQEGSRIETRLGLDSMRVPLDKEVKSPFGALLAEITIPAHLVPNGFLGDVAEVLSEEGGEVHIRLGDAFYRYSRFGLERENERPQSAD